MTWLASLDLRWLTAAALGLIGLATTLSALRVWWMSPKARVRLFGPFLTEIGLRTVLESCPLAFRVGLWLIVLSISKLAYYERWHGAVATDVANAIGLMEAIFSVWIVITLGMALTRAWRHR